MATRGSECAGRPVAPCWAVIPARNESAMVGATVKAALSVTGMAGAVVVDDASADDTAAAAAAAGAAVLRLERRAGKGGALEAGLGRIPAGAAAVLFLDADLGPTARDAGTLLDAVRSGADMAVAVLGRAAGAGGLGAVKRLAGWGVHRLTGRRVAAALSGQRCLTRSAAEALRPFAPGWGAEVAMTVAALRLGLDVREVPAAMTHRASGWGAGGVMHRGRQFIGVARALAAAAARGRRGAGGGR